MFRIRSTTDALAWAWLAGIVAVIIIIGAAAWKLGSFVVGLFT